MDNAETLQGAPEKSAAENDASTREEPRRDKPFLRVQPESGWSVLDLRQVWRFRDLLTTLAARDVKLRYRQTALGAVWVILQPLIGAAIFSFVFNKIANLPTDGVPPLVFSYIGMLGYTIFSNTLTKASNSLVQNAGMISKVFFPRLVLPLSTIFSTLVDFVVATAMLLVLMLVHHVGLSIGMVLLPLWIFLLLLMSLGGGLFFAALMVSYRDVQYVLPVLISFLTFASPIAYPASYVLAKLPVGAQPFYFLLNPLAALLEAFRWSLLGRGVVPWGWVGYAAFVSVVIFVGGAFAFKKMEGRFADVI